MSNEKIKFAGAGIAELIYVDCVDLDTNMHGYHLIFNLNGRTKKVHVNISQMDTYKRTDAFWNFFNEQENLFRQE